MSGVTAAPEGAPVAQERPADEFRQAREAAPPPHSKPEVPARRCGPFTEGNFRADIDAPGAGSVHVVECRVTPRQDGRQWSIHVAYKAAPLAWVEVHFQRASEGRKGNPLTPASSRFLRGAMAAALMAIVAQLDEADHAEEARDLAARAQAAGT